MALGGQTMIGLEAAEVDRWSDRVVVALGMNPSLFTGPGTNTYLVGTGSRRILIDTGQGVPAYVPVLTRALAEAGCDGIESVVLTHGHPDHMGGVAALAERFGAERVFKLPWEPFDATCPLPITPLADGAVLRTAGATLRALHTPGHAPDHLCFVLEEERAMFSGDNVLGVGTTVIPTESGDLRSYMASLARMLAERPARIYPAHGPVIEDGVAKLEAYIAHREARERALLTALEAGPGTVPDLVRRVYTDTPEVLHRAAAQSLTSHLRKLEAEGRARRSGEGEAATWARCEAGPRPQ